MNVLFFLTPKAETSFLDQNCSVRQALEKLDHHKFTVIPLLNKKGQFVSTISEGDVLRYIKDYHGFNLESAQEVKLSKVLRYRPYKSLSIDSSLEEIVELSLHQNFIPIVDDRDCYIGIIKRKDVINFLYNNYKAGVSNA